MTNRILRLANIISFKYKIAGDGDPLIDPEVSKNIVQRQTSGRDEIFARDSLRNLKDIQPVGVTRAFFNLALNFDYPPAKFVIDSMNSAGEMWATKDLNDPLELLEIAQAELIQDIHNGNIAYEEYKKDIADRNLQEIPKKNPYSFIMNRSVTAFKRSKLDEDPKTQAYSEYMLHAKAIFGILKNVIRNLKMALLLPVDKDININLKREPLISVVAKKAWLDNYGEKFGINGENAFAIVNNSELGPTLRYFITRFNRGIDISDKKKIAFKENIASLFRNIHDKESNRMGDSNVGVATNTGIIPGLEPQVKIEKLVERLQNGEISKVEYLRIYHELTGKYPGHQAAEMDLAQNRNTTMKNTILDLERADLPGNIHENENEIEEIEKKIKSILEKISKKENKKRVTRLNREEIEDLDWEIEELIAQKNKCELEVKRLENLSTVQSKLENEIDPSLLETDPSRYEGYGDKL